MDYPGLVVFDLDFTLWDCGGLWIDCTTHPFRLDPDGVVIDGSGRRFRLYDDVEEILEQLDGFGVPMALASRTGRPDWAEELLDLWNLKDRFSYREIYPDSKISHFRNLSADSGIPLKEMIFFDDEERNIVEVSALGVQCHLVSNGLSTRYLERSLKSFSEKV